MQFVSNGNATSAGKRREITDVNDITKSNIVFGEKYHTNTAARKMLIENMEYFAQCGFKTIFLEHVPYDGNAEAVEETLNLFDYGSCFYCSDSTKEKKEELVKYSLKR